MRFETLSDKFILNEFNCGETKINDFLKEKALVWQNENITSCKLLLDKDKVIGYFTLSPSSAKRKYFKNIDPESTPKDIPIILLGMMGIDKTRKGNGLGGIILTEIMLQTYGLYSRTNLKFRAIGVDALNESSAAFFEHYGFYRIKHTKKLFLPIQDIEFHLTKHDLI